MIRRLKIAGLVLLALLLLPVGGLFDLAARHTRSIALRSIAEDFGAAHDRILSKIEGLME
jgi:hypothetical protein